MRHDRRKLIVADGHIPSAKSHESNAIDEPASPRAVSRRLTLPALSHTMPHVARLYFCTHEKETCYP
jgi:hypothetical protein